MLVLISSSPSIIFNASFAYNQPENIFRPQGARCEQGTLTYVSLENSADFPLKPWAQI